MRLMVAHYDVSPLISCAWSSLIPMMTVPNFIFIDIMFVDNWLFTYQLFQNMIPTVEVKTMCVSCVHLKISAVSKSQKFTLV